MTHQLQAGTKNILRKLTQLLSALVFIQRIINDINKLLHRT